MLRPWTRKNTYSTFLFDNEDVFIGHGQEDLQVVKFKPPDFIHSVFCVDSSIRSVLLNGL